MFLNQSGSEGTLEQVADHIDHIRAVAGIDHVGLGSDLDGLVTGPIGLKDVSRYPALIYLLLASPFPGFLLNRVSIASFCGIPGFRVGLSFPESPRRIGVPKCEAIFARALTRTRRGVGEESPANALRAARAPAGDREACSRTDRHCRSGPTGGPCGAAARRYQTGG